jgi:quercetin dioxygenase-like cupin family protein
VPFLTIADLPPREPRAGWVGRFFHSDHMTFAAYEIAPGADVHQHSHPHEEVWSVLEGELELVIDGERRILSAGDAAIVPSGASHSARAVARCRAIIIDHPVREAVGGVQTME